MAWMQISTELTITLTSYLPRTLVVTSQTAFIVIILVVKLRRTVSQFMWRAPCFSFVRNFRQLTYPKLSIFECGGEQRFDLHNNFFFLLRVSMHQERGVFTTKLSWGLLGLVRLIKICKKLNTWVAVHSSKTFENLETAANSTEKFPEIPETVEFPKCKPFNRKF